jgi:hypothetical protein
MRTLFEIGFMKIENINLAEEKRKMLLLNRFYSLFNLTFFLLPKSIKFSSLPLRRDALGRY